MAQEEIFNEIVGGQKELWKVAPECELRKQKGGTYESVKQIER